MHFVVFFFFFSTASTCFKHPSKKVKRFLKIVWMLLAGIVVPVIEIINL